jgi:hypothetical protein
VVAARTRAGEVLASGVREKVGDDPGVTGIAAWSLVHGFATLWLTDALPPRLGDDPAAAAREVAGTLFR